MDLFCGFVDGAVVRDADGVFQVQDVHTFISFGVYGKRSC
jgi:hypothetical protein